MRTPIAVIHFTFFVRDLLIESYVNYQKCPDVHKIVLSIKLPSPPWKCVNFEDFVLICTVFPHLGPFLGGGGGVKPNFADKNFMDTQTFLKLIPPRARCVILLWHAQDTDDYCRVRNDYLIILKRALS